MVIRWSDANVSAELVGGASIDELLMFAESVGALASSAENPPTTWTGRSPLDAIPPPNDPLALTFTSSRMQSSARASRDHAAIAFENLASGSVAHATSNQPSNAAGSDG